MGRYILILALVTAAPFIVWTFLRLIQGGPAREAPTGRLLAIAAGGAIVTLLVFGVLAVNEGSRDGVYTPPSLQDGQVRPGRFEDRQPEPGGDPAR